MALLAVEDAGSDEPLVLIHGLATTREIWSAVGPELSRSRRVVTLDVPGFGESVPVVPIEHALQLAAALPNCHVFFDADDGHHFFRRRLREIVGVLVGRHDQVGSRGATSLRHAREIVAMRRYPGEYASREGRAVSGAARRRAAAADAEPVGRRLRKAA